jgi:putative PIN family toxin of toxin-antitoxin system
VIDTNVLVSALLSSEGYPNSVWSKVVVGEYTLYYSNEIFHEYVDVLFRAKLRIVENEREDMLSFIQRHGIKISPAKSNSEFADEDDRVFYDVAKEAGATTRRERHTSCITSINSPIQHLQF